MAPGTLVQGTEQKTMEGGEDGSKHRSGVFTVRSLRVHWIRVPDAASGVTGKKRKHAGISASAEKSPATAQTAATKPLATKPKKKVVLDFRENSYAQGAYQRVVQCKKDGQAKKPRCRLCLSDEHLQASCPRKSETDVEKFGGAMPEKGERCPHDGKVLDGRCKCVKCHAKFPGLVYCYEVERGIMNWTKHDSREKFHEQGLCSDTRKPLVRPDRSLGGAFDNSSAAVASRSIVARAAHVQEASSSDDRSTESIQLGIRRTTERLESQGDLTGCWQSTLELASLDPVLMAAASLELERRRSVAEARDALAAAARARFSITELPKNHAEVLSRYRTVVTAQVAQRRGFELTKEEIAAIIVPGVMALPRTITPGSEPFAEVVSASDFLAGMDDSMLVPLRVTLSCMLRFSWSMRLCPNHIAGLVEIFCTFFARRLDLDVGFEASMQRHGLSMSIIGRLAPRQAAAVADPAAAAADPAAAADTTAAAADAADPAPRQGWYGYTLRASEPLHDPKIAPKTATQQIMETFITTFAREAHIRLTPQEVYDFGTTTIHTDDRIVGRTGEIAHWLYRKPSAALNHLDLDGAPLVAARHFIKPMMRPAGALIMLSHAFNPDTRENALVSFRRMTLLLGNGNAERGFHHMFVTALEDGWRPNRFVLTQEVHDQLRTLLPTSAEPLPTSAEPLQIHSADETDTEPLQMQGVGHTVIEVLDSDDETDDEPLHIVIELLESDDETVEK